MHNARPLDLTEHAVNAFLASSVESQGFPGDAHLLADLASEARLAVRMLSSLNPTVESRLLEIGSGAGVVAAFLHGQGASITAIEPLMEGFAQFREVNDELRARESVPEILDIPASELDPTRHGWFDLIYSVNVVEHMNPLNTNLDALVRVLAVGGRMVHTCPNYRVPYEPHLRFPLVPGRPSLTGSLLPRLRRDPVWPTLNWVTAGDIRDFARRHGLELEFLPGQLAAALARLREDPAFARRQSRIVGALRLPGVARLLSSLPPDWSTPMTFVLERDATSKDRAGT